jgi:N4-gp56 family major capsid protein
MAIQNIATQAARIGKFKGDILKHAIPVEVLGITGMNKPMPKNNSKVVSFRRWLPPGGVDNIWITSGNMEAYADSYETVEGQTPNAKTMTAVDITATMRQFAVLFAVTDQTVDMYEDDIPMAMKVQTGETMGLIREMVRYGELRGATNAYYAGGSNRGTVDEAISLNLLRKVTKSLLNNHAKRVTKVLSSSGNYGTQAVEAGFLVFCSTDLESTIRDLPGFTNCVDYGSKQPINENEIGSVERFRFILSPELAGYANAGAAVGSTGLYSSNGVNIDVYPVIVCGEDAWGQVALRGADSIDPTWQPPGQKDKSDPLGQRGYIGAKAYHTAVILNQGFMALIEAGADDLA